MRLMLLVQVEAIVVVFLLQKYPLCKMLSSNPDTMMHERGPHEALLLIES